MAGEIVYMKDLYQAPVANYQSVAVQQNYVGFWQRAFATLVDMILSTIVLLPPMYLLFGPGILGIDSANHPGPAYSILSLALSAAIVFMFWIKKSATPGKMLIDSKIVDADTGGKPSVKQWIIRYFGYLIAILPLFLGVLCIARDSRKQGWHDKLANTLVIKNTE